MNAMTPAKRFGADFRLMIIFVFIFPALVNSEENPPQNPGAMNLPSDCQNKPLKPGPSAKIHVHIFFDTVGAGAYTKINALVCLNMPDFGDQLQLDFRPGAGSEDLNGKLDCSWESCDEAIALQCARNRVKSYKNFMCCRVKGQDNVKCAKDQGIDWDKEIKPCLTTEEPINEIKETVALRQKYNMSKTMIPGIVVNGVYDFCTDMNMSNDFVNSSCKLLNPKPKVCN